MQSRWPREAWIPLATGLAWFFFGAADGFVSFALGALPGMLLVASGVATLLWPGDQRPAQFMALGGVIGVLIGLPMAFALDVFTALLLALASAASFVCAGLSSIRNAPHPAGVPEPQPSWKLAARTALDEAILADLSLSASFPSGVHASRVIGEVQAACELFRDRGWLDTPADYHELPPELVSPQLRPRRSRGIDFEHLTFASDYEPRPDEPGRDRWLSHRDNRNAHAWVLRHAGAPRPWVVCIHGFRMGVPLIDLSAFAPTFFHQKLGLNMLLPVLPLHGPRKLGRRSGDGYLDGDVLDTVHAQAQAAWDIRRMLSWLRSQHAPCIGVYGLSLGGYNTALLAGLDSELACAVAGIPATDFSRIFWHHGPPAQIAALEAAGLRYEDVAAAMSVVSPLALAPQLAAADLAIFGGVTDRIVPPDQVRDLALHWGQSPIVWYQGGHMTFNSDPRVRQCLESTLRGRLFDPRLDVPLAAAGN